MSAASMLRLCLLVVPRLATLTYAAPHLIMHNSVAVNLKATSVRHSRLQSRVIRKSKAAIVAPPPVVAPPPPKTSAPRGGLLVYKDDAWRTTPSLTPDLVDGEISDARLDRRTINSRGDTEWTVEAPITFSYHVRECPDVLNPRSDALLFGHLSDGATLARARARKLKRVVVVDSVVHQLHGERIEAYFAHHDVETRLLVLPTTEENKNMDMVLTIAEAIHDLGIDRRLDPVIAIGGGVCMDIVGFAASIYRRKTPYVRVPTTLMGYVDASIGAKTGVNFAGKKNKLGAYVPPALTLLDRSFLGTLDARQLSNGAAEIVKMALVKDAELFTLLEEHGPSLIEGKFQDRPGDVESNAVSAPSRVLTLAIQTMLEELAPNLWEDSLTRCGSTLAVVPTPLTPATTVPVCHSSRLVDFGHIFSMELEMEALHSNKLFHGEAVAIDMALCACLATVRGHIDSSVRDRILAVMRGLRLPTYHELLDEKMALFAIEERIKFSQTIKMPLPVGVGASRIYDDISSDEIVAALAMAKRLSAEPEFSP